MCVSEHLNLGALKEKHIFFCNSKLDSWFIVLNCQILSWKQWVLDFSMGESEQSQATRCLIS